MSVSDYLKQLITEGKHSMNVANIPLKKAREYAEYYTRRFIDYMNFNQNLFPEYYSNSNDDIDPSQDAIFNGWVL